MGSSFRGARRAQGGNQEMSDGGKPRGTKGRGTGTEAREPAGSLEGARIKRGQTGSDFQRRQQEWGIGRNGRIPGPIPQVPAKASHWLILTRSLWQGSSGEAEFAQGSPLGWEPMEERRVWLWEQHGPWPTHPCSHTSTLTDEENTFLPLGCRVHFLRCVSRDSKRLNI